MAIMRDYRGLKCPLPVLKARRTLSELSSGSELEILADDPAAPLDMTHFCDTEGHQVALFDLLAGQRQPASADIDIQRCVGASRPVVAAASAHADEELGRLVRFTFAIECPCIVFSHPFSDVALMKIMVRVDAFQCQTN